MEEDIKKCEEFISLSFLYGKLSFTKTQLYDYQKAIANLLARYKNLEQIEQSHKKENGELRERVKELEEEKEQYKNDYYSLVNKIENKIDKFDYEFEKAKRKNNNDRADYYWDLIGNFTNILREE